MRTSSVAHCALSLAAALAKANSKQHSAAEGAVDPRLTHGRADVVKFPAKLEGNLEFSLKPLWGWASAITKGYLKVSRDLRQGDLGKT
jgi:hypothetical protein